MAGALNSGRDVLIEIANTRFRELMLTELRNDPSRACRDGTAEWIVDAHVAGFDGFALFTLTRMTSESPMPSGTFPFPLEPFVASSLPTSLPFLGDLVGTAIAVNAVNLRATSQGTVIAGYDLDIGTAPDEMAWSAFLTDFLTVSGIAHDWGIAIDRTIMQSILSRAVAEQAGTSIKINEATEDFFIERFNIESISASWGNPIRLHVRGELVVSGPDIDLEFDATARFRLDAQSRLFLDVRMDEDSISVDFWDGVQRVLSDPAVLLALFVAGPLAASLVAAIRFGGGTGPRGIGIPEQDFGVIRFDLAKLVI